MLYGNVESALLSNVAYRESFSAFKRKSQAFKLNLPHTGRVRTGKLLPVRERSDDPSRILCEPWLSGRGN